MLFRSKLLQEGGKYVVAVGECRVELSEEKQKALSARKVTAQDITLGVRPSHITLGGGKNTLTATVDVSEMMGSEIYLHTNSGGRDVVIIVPTMDLQGNHQQTFAQGIQIQFPFHGNVRHVFDREGKNLEF